MIKILQECHNRLYLSPNCLLTRKPVLVVSSTSGLGWNAIPAWIKRRFFHWQISRHGYKTLWPVPRDLLVHRNPNFHYLDVDKIKFANCIDFLIVCAENDYNSYLDE